MTSPTSTLGAATARSLTLVSAEVPRLHVEAVADWLTEAGVSSSAWEDWEGGPSRIDIFLEEVDGAESAMLAIRQAGEACSLTLDPVTSVLKDEDWTEVWKRFFHITHISPHVVVRPPWEAYVPVADEQVIVMDPGMSFGTGRHGTTQACLRMLDDLAQGDRSRSVLDVGCGSGILSIAAAKLGFRTVRGFDNDPDAVRIAAENAALNGVAVTYAVGDLATSSARADIVVANVLASVLSEYAPQVAAMVQPGPGHALLLSGILDCQYAAVAACYVRLGFVEQKSVLVAEWRSGWFVRG